MTLAFSTDHPRMNTTTTTYLRHILLPHQHHTCCTSWLWFGSDVYSWSTNDDDEVHCKVLLLCDSKGCCCCCFYWSSNVVWGCFGGIEGFDDRIVVVRNTYQKCAAIDQALD
jgi:hypothetical protein